MSAIRVVGAAGVLLDLSAPVQLGSSGVPDLFEHANGLGVRFVGRNTASPGPVQVRLGQALTVLALLHHRGFFTTALLPEMNGSFNAAAVAPRAVLPQVTTLTADERRR